MIFKLILWVAYIAGDVYYNYYTIEKKGQRPNYLLMNIVRGMAFILYGAFIWDTQYEWRTFFIFLYCVTSFWLLFDLSLNIARKKHPFYIGKESGWIDQYGFKNPGMYYVGKVVALVLLIWSLQQIGA